MHAFQLTKDLVFFDIESTGLNVVRDRIIQIALIKFSPNQTEPIEREYLLNPEMPISPEAEAIHGISLEMVKDQPKFADIALELYQFIGQADLAGYNSDRFDVPMLMEEFFRAGYEFDLDERKLLDVQKIFYKMEPRTLKAAYKLYCEKDLLDAHDALSDVRATVEVLEGQIKKYRGVDYIDPDGKITPNPITADIHSISDFLAEHGTLDVTQRLRKDINGEIVFNFGKHIGKPVAKTLYEDRQYFQWIQEKEFSAQVKSITKKLLEAYELERKKR